MQYTQSSTVAGTNNSHLRGLGSVVLGTIIALGCSTTTVAWQDSTDASSTSDTATSGQWYTVTGRNVNIRCAPNISGSYAIGKLQKGEEVLLTSQANGWGSIQTTGDAFANVYGLLQANNKVKVYGNMVEVLSSTPLKAPYVAAENDPTRSWHQLLTLKPGTTLKVHSRFQSAVNDTTNTWLLVQMPSNATVYVNMAFLAPVNPEATETAPAAPQEEETSEETSEETASAASTTDDDSTDAATDSASQTDAADEPQDATAATGTDETTDEAETSDEADTSDAAQEETAGTETIDESFDPADGSASGAKLKSIDDPFRDVTIEQAEDAWASMRNDGGADKEIETLQLIFTVIASNEESSPEARRMAELRIRQLEMHRQVQERLRRLETIKQRNTVDRTRMQNAQILIEARASYDAVGRINASQVYDGKRLPQLFRLQAPAGGRTIGYIRPNEDLDMLPMLGRLVGIVGPKNYDAGYRLLIVTPKRIDILTATADGE